MDWHLLFVVETLAAPPDGLAVRLADCGFRVRRAAGLCEAKRSLNQRAPSLVAIHVTTSEGATLCRELRSLTAVPILAFCEGPRAIECLEAGADCALSEDTSRRVINARLRALLAAPGLWDMPLAERESYRVGAVEIDAGSHRAQNGGRSLDLTPTEFRLLLALARRGGEVVPHSELIDEVWRGGSQDGHENLRLYVRYLRRKLGDDPKGPRLVLSHRGQGYALAQGVRLVEEEGVGHA